MSNKTQNIIDTNPTPFSAIPVELNNYYPFGMPEAGRSWSYQGEIFESQSKYQDYTYGYNGMQRDNSKGVGSGYTTLFREYDPEICRWKSLDPKLKDFPSESPFSAMGNNPIMNTDVLGDDYFFNFKTGAIYYNNTYTKNDINKIKGSNWAHLGTNDMFKECDGDVKNSDAVLLPTAKETPITRITDYGKGPLKANVQRIGTMREALLDPKDAKQFMSSRGYSFKPLIEEIKYERTQFHHLDEYGNSMYLYDEKRNIISLSVISSAYIKNGLTHNADDFETITTKSSVTDATTSWPTQTTFIRAVVLNQYGSTNTWDNILQIGVGLIDIYNKAEPEDPYLPDLLNKYFMKLRNIKK